MGIGSALSFGCNIGGFFSATSALSLAGPAMMIGLIVGSFLGRKLLVWEITYLSPAVLKNLLLPLRKLLVKFTTTFHWFHHYPNSFGVSFHL